MNGGRCHGLASVSQLLDVAAGGADVLCEWNVARCPPCSHCVVVVVQRMGGGDEYNRGGSKEGIPHLVKSTPKKEYEERGLGADKPAERIKSVDPIQIPELVSFPRSPFTSQN